MDANGQPLNLSDAARLRQSLAEQLSIKQVRPLAPRPVPRRLQPFMGRAEIKLNGFDGKTKLEIAATDRPGLLSAIAEALVARGVRLYDARVATFGQRVEDVFLIADREGQPLNEQASRELEAELRSRLDIKKKRRSGFPFPGSGKQRLKCFVSP